MTQTTTQEKPTSAKSPTEAFENGFKALANTMIQGFRGIYEQLDGIRQMTYIVNREVLDAWNAEQEANRDEEE